jgi:hypothetical protein
MLTWQGLEKTCIVIYFSDQTLVTKIEYLSWSTLKSNYYQTSIDFELNFFLTWFNTLYTTTFMFTNLDFIHTIICYGFLNENNHQEYLVLLVVVHKTKSFCTFTMNPMAQQCKGKERYSTSSVGYDNIITNGK